MVKIISPFWTSKVVQNSTKLKTDQLNWNIESACKPTSRVREVQNHDHNNIKVWLSREVRAILLTNDLTEEVVEEAVQRGAGLIFSYHPPIFRPLKRITNASWKVRRLFMYASRTATVMWAVLLWKVFASLQLPTFTSCSRVVLPVFLWTVLYQQNQLHVLSFVWLLFLFSFMSYT